ncbi:MAG: hypothetical protein JWN20_1537, partial [Jatrophihabitantaceae bacterium]|nr:hypothetical protein [Jatrophihabitantaceae bacterium]
MPAPNRDDRSAMRPAQSSFTQRLARTAAVRPWRVVSVWLLILAASIIAIGSLVGSAFTSDASLTTSTESATAQRMIDANFPESDRVDESVIVYSAEYTADDPRFKAVVAGLIDSIARNPAVVSVGNPYDPGAPALSEDAHGAMLTLTLGENAESGIEAVLRDVAAADAAPGFEVDITGANTVDHDFAELSASDLTNGELKFGLPAAMIVLILVFGALVAAFLPMTIAIGSIIVTVAISSVVGQFTSVSFFIVNMITAMGLALGIDYSLFVLSRYREERLAGRPKIEAIVVTGGTSSKAVLFSGTSFVVALLGLLLVPDTILRSLAIGAIIVGFVTMAAALTL